MVNEFHKEEFKTELIFCKKIDEIAKLTSSDNRRHAVFFIFYTVFRKKHPLTFSFISP